MYWCFVNRMEYRPTPSNGRTVMADELAYFDMLPANFPG